MRCSFILFCALCPLLAQGAELRWEERLPSGAIVQGHVQFDDAGHAQEVYELNGVALPADKAKAMGIRPKSWGSTADIPSGLPATTAPPMPSVPAPKGARLKSAPFTVDATPEAAALAAHQAVAESDAAKGLLHTGLFVALAAPFVVEGDQVSLGSWETLEDGARVARFAIDSLGAAGIRVGFSQLTLPPGAYALVYGTDGAPAFGPFRSISPDASLLWSPTVSGNLAQVEVVVPATADLSSVVVEVRQIIHQYFDPAQLLKANAGACNLDVTCHPTWATTALGVGGLGVVGNTGSLFCTGTLLNDEDPCTDTPFVLTARHCVGGQTASDSLEFYWQYQTPTCNGTPPSPSSVPRTTGGADYLAGSGGTGISGGGNDFSLLRMRNNPPSGLTRVGFNSSPQPLGAPVTCVHHPRGDFKRITFGSLTATDNNFPSLYHEVIWTQGTTEPGSSGSPMLLTATQQIIGQLWGGGASCTNLSAPDYYGRFDLTYPVIAGFLSSTTVGFDSATYTESEGTGIATIGISLSSPAPSGGVSVQCALSAGTAQPGSDYVDVVATVNFAAGQVSRSFTVALVDDTHTEPDETLTLTLFNPTGCVGLSSGNAVAELTIVDDDLDTDGDGISDADELSGFFGYVTDPLLADSDGDGLTDWEEQSGEPGFLTDPNNPDSDGDGIGDGLERSFGTDPNVPNPYYLPSLTIPLFRE